MKYSLPTALLAILFFASCQKVIDLDLKTSEIKYVLVGEVVAGDSTHHLSITQSVNFDQPNTFPQITGAFVTLSDDLGNTTTLLDLGEGKYEAQNYLAVQGRTYTMRVIIGDKTIESTCTIPMTVALLGANVLTNIFFGEEVNFIVPDFQDPADVVNYYKFRYFKKDSVEFNDSGDLIADDAFSNGQVNQQPFIGNYAPNSGDTVILKMEGIPESVYRFFFSKITNTSSTSASPANPISNWSGDVLGYFSAHNSQTTQLVIP